MKSFIHFMVHIFLFLFLLSEIYKFILYLLKKFSKKDDNKHDDNDDIFFDNAPLPKLPPSFPPSETHLTPDQIAFKEFIRKYREKEKEKVHR